MTARLSLLGAVVILVGCLVSADGGDASAVLQEEGVDVTWEFGSGPGRTSIRWVGSAKVPVVYKPASCRNQFVLEKLEHECPIMAETNERQCPAFLSATFRKLVAGPAEIPQLEVVRHKYNKKKERTGKTHADIVPYSRMMAAQVDDWSEADIDVFVAMPAPELHNPTGWAEVRVLCDR